MASATKEQDEMEVSQDVKLYIQSLPLARNQIPVHLRNDFKQLGMELYNKYTVLAADDAQTNPSKAHTVLVRALALLMLSSLGKPKPAAAIEISSLINAALSTTRQCLRVDEIDVASKLVEHFTINEAMHNSDQEQHGLPDGFQKCLLTYYCLRLSLAWKTERLDLAEHWYNHIEALLRAYSSSFDEALCDLLLEIGLQELRRSNTAEAITWLGRAYSCLQSEDLKANFLATDLHLNVLHAYFRALHKSADIDHLQLAGQVMGELRQEYGTKLSVRLLFLESMKPGLPSNVAQFTQTLTEMVYSAPLVDTTHHLILYHVSILYEFDPYSAQDIFGQYINKRLAPESMTNWTEEALIQYLWLCAGCGGNAQLMDASELHFKLDEVSVALVSTLSYDAAQAAQSIVWKVITQFGSENSQASTISWCRIGLHRLFEQSDDASIGKLERKLAMCYLSTSDLEAAQSVLDRMSFLRRNHRLSHFLAYALAIRTDHEVEAQVALNTIANAPEDNSILLLACAGEVKRHGSAMEIARLLQRLFDRQVQRPIIGIEKTSLLKSVTQVLIRVTEEEHFRDNEEIFVRLCASFKAASSQLEKTSVLWFANMAYELGVGKSTVWPSRFILDILHYGERLWLMSQTTSSSTSSTDKQLYWRTLELQVLLYACDARRAASEALTAEELPKASYENKARPDTDEIPRLLNEQVYKKFTLLHQEYVQSEHSAIDLDSHSRLQDLFPVAFEALLNLNTIGFVETHDLAFDEASLHGLLRSAQQLPVPAGTYALLADQILTATSTQVEHVPKNARMPLLVGARLLGQIITSLRDLEVYDIGQAARWIRCIVQLIIYRLEQQLQEGVDDGKLEKSGLSMLRIVIRQAIDLACGSAGNNEVCDVEDVIMSDHESTLVAQSSYPVEELEWLATKVFNMSIDLVVACRMRTATFWSQKALEITDVLMRIHSDQGADLYDLLRQRIHDLGLDRGHNPADDEFA